MHALQTGWDNFIKKFPDPIARYDKEYKHLFINQAIEQEIYMPASEIIGKSNRDIGIPNRESCLSELESNIKRVFETAQPAVNYAQHEFPYGTRYYYMKLIPDFHDQAEQEGKVRSVWAITRDITHLKQTEIDLQHAEVNLRKQNLELNQLNVDLDIFFDAVSHDLRGPLHNMKGLIELIKDEGQDQIPAYIQMLEKTTQRLDDVLTGLIELLEAKNKQDVKVALDSVLQVITAELQGNIDQTGATIKADFSSCPAVYFARPYLESLFRNLVSNAIKYRSDSRSPYIQITAKQEDGLMTLTFQDNGQGIDLEINGEKIFRPFYQVDGEQEGRGMGLNIVKSILENSGGKIEVKSQLGIGTTFICYISN